MSAMSPVATLVRDLSFGEALQVVVSGQKVTRTAWPQSEHGQRDCLMLHANTLHLRKVDGTMHTLIVSEGDITATDWIEVREN